MAKRKKPLGVIDVRPGETEEDALKRAEGHLAMPIDDLEIEPTPKAALNVAQMAAAAADLTAFVQKGMKAQQAVDEVMKKHGVQVELREDPKIKTPRVEAQGVTHLITGDAAVAMSKQDARAEVLNLQPVLTDVRMVPVDDVSESPNNPRRTFEGMDELVASVKQHGILSPIMVVPSVEAGKPWRLVFGHRRLRAAKKAGLDSVPAILRAPMSEAQVLEAQLIENCQRADIAELEEGEAYQRLLKDFGYSVDQIASKVGKSKRTIYTRIQLVNLIPEARAALNQKKLSPSTALLVARIPNELQQKALAGVTQTGPNGEQMSVRDASDYIQTNFMLKLSDAPFDTGDDMLVPSCGSCKACPKRTGNARDLFSDVGAADVCTDPPCYHGKVEALWEGLTAKAEAKGHKILAPSISRPLYRTGKLQFDAAYVERNAPCPEDAKRRTWKKLVDWAGVEVPVYIGADANGFPHELFKRDDLAEVLKAMGAKVTASNDDGEPEAKKTPATPEQKAKASDDRKAREVRQQVAGEAMGQAIKVIEKQGLNAAHLRIMALGLLHIMKPEATVERRGTTEGALTKQVAKLDARPLMGLVFELATAEYLGEQWAGYTPELKALAKVFGVDLKKLERDAAAAAELGLGKKAKK